MHHPARQLFSAALFAALLGCGALGVHAADETGSTPSAAAAPDPSSTAAPTTTTGSAAAGSKIDKFAAKLNQISDALNALAALKQNASNPADTTPSTASTGSSPTDATPPATSPASPASPDSSPATEASPAPTPAPAMATPRSTASRSAMGIRVRKLDQATAAAIGDPELKGTLIVAVNRGSPAAAAGLKAGDIILDAGGQPFDLATIGKQRQQGQPTVLHVRQRGGQVTELTISVPSATSNNAASAASVAAGSASTAPTVEVALAEAASTTPDLSTLAGTYRCRSYNVGGAGGRPPVGTPPLVLNANGTYSMSSEHGTYTVKGDTLVLSQSKIRGAGKLNGNQVVFEYDFKGLHHVVTYVKQ